MRHRGATRQSPEIRVEAVGYDDVQELRVRWMREMDAPDGAGYHAQAREVALLRGAEVLAVREGGELVAFAQLLRDGAAAEVAQVYVEPAFRGGGRGTALTTAAIRAAGEVDDLWICADDDDRAKDSIRSLGLTRRGEGWCSRACRDGVPRPAVTFTRLAATGLYTQKPPQMRGVSRMRRKPRRSARPRIPRRSGGRIA